MAKDTARIERASYSAKEIAERNQLSIAKVFKDIRLGLLRATRLGGNGPVRITPADELMWLEGRRSPDDPAALGVDPQRSALPANTSES